MEETTLIEFGSKIRKNDVDVTITYGSGGFCVVLKHTLSGKMFSGYSWAITDAVSKAFKKLNIDEADEEFDEDDTPTKPDLKFDTSYKIVNR